MAFDLPRLPLFQPQSWDELAGFMASLQIWWQQVVEAIETQETTQDDLLAQIIAAQATAAAAQTTADAVKKTDKISGSFAYSATPPVITATDAGSDATITVKAHTRKWGDSTSTSVNSHTFTGKAYSTLYFVYYDDPNQNDTTPSYQITTSASVAAANSSTNRVYVGAITTPAALGSDTEGGTTIPSGGDIPARSIQ